jgi:flagellar M-ring protein FliF
MPIRQFASKLTPKGWAMVGGSVAVAIVFLMLVMNFASKPSYSTLLTGLDPAQTGKITSALDAKGIGYELQNGGTALAVNSSQTSQARIALAAGGLLGSQQPGFSLLDKQQLGASNFQQQVTYERALEGQLDQTIQQIQGVDSAQVNLVIPNQQDQLFADTSQSSSASVLLSAPNLDSGSIKGIAQLVASSVPGLSASKVTITDGSGALLWPTSSGTSGDSGGLPAAQSANQHYDSMMAAQVDAVLAQTLGPGKAQAVVNADLNDNQATQQSLHYTGKAIPLTQQKSTESLTGGSGTSGGVTGTIPAYAATGATGSSNYKNTTSNTAFGVDKTITNSTIAPGAINRQTVSVLVNSSVPASSVPAIKNAVAAAVGLNPKRGDLITVSQLPFAKTTTTTKPAAAGTSKMIGYAKYGVIGLGALLFLFFTTRALRRREKETFPQPTWLSELEMPRPLAALGGGAGEAQTEIRQLASTGPTNVPRRQVEQLVEREPDRVAQQVRAWMSED